MTNFSKDPSLMDQVSTGDTLLDCNCSQETETEVFAGAQNLKIIRGNSTNCIFPNSTKVSQTNQSRNTYENGVNVGNNGRFNNTKMSAQARKNIMKSNEITNKTIKQNFKREIEKAKAVVMEQI